MTSTPHATWAQKTAIQTITFRVGTCTLGLVLVATTPHGVCAILLGSDEKALVGQPRSIFPRAVLQKDSKELDKVLNRVVQFIETPAATLALLLDIGERPSRSESGTRYESFRQVRLQPTRNSH